MKSTGLLLLALLLSVSACGTGAEQMSVIGSERRDGYECMLVEYSGGLRSYLLVPDCASAGSPRPGLVLLHDHGARFDIGKEKLVKPLAGVPENIRLSSAQWARDNFDGVYLADSLASLGYVVIVPDMLYWGERCSDACREWSQLKFAGADGLPEGSRDGGAGDRDRKTALDSLKKVVYEGQRAVYDSLYARGEIWAWKTLEEDASAARMLAGLEYVDNDRIGVFGWSMGAHRAWMLAAFCPEISGGVSLSWMTLKETVEEPYKASDYAMLVPSLRERHDFPDIALKLAPKPYLFLSGTEDRLFPAGTVAKAFARMQEIYTEKGAEGRLRTEFFEGGHHCGKEVQSVIVDFFDSLFSVEKQ